MKEKNDSVQKYPCLINHLLECTYNLVVNFNFSYKCFSYTDVTHYLFTTITFYTSIIFFTTKKEVISHLKMKRNQKCLCYSFFSYYSVFDKVVLFVSSFPMFIYIRDVLKCFSQWVYILIFQKQLEIRKKYIQN